MPVAALAVALMEGDERALTRISGVGQKNARRLILELKDRVQEKAGVFSRGPATAHGQPRDDAVKALIALGFPARDSEAAVNAAAAKAWRMHDRGACEGCTRAYKGAMIDDRSSQFAGRTR